MKNLFAGFLFALGMYAAPALAQVPCQPPSGWLLQYGIINTGDSLSYGPNCGQLQTTGGASVNVNPSGYYSVTKFGAAGNGIVNDLPAIQAAITACEAATPKGGIVWFPAGSYKVTGPIVSGTSCTNYMGVGYQGDEGGVYKAQAVTATTGYTGSVIVCTGNIDCFQGATNKAFHISGLQFTYPVQPSSGFAAIRLNPTAGAAQSNTGTVLRDVYVTGADRCFAFTDILDFVVDHITCELGWSFGAVIVNSNYPSFGDSVISNSTFIGNGVPGYAGHIYLGAMGGLRIVNNKLNNGSGTNTNAIYINPALAVSQAVEPLVIANNSIEGSAVGIAFINSNVANATITQVTITGNQIWTGGPTINVTTNGATQWIGAMTISGNALQVVGGVGVQAMVLNNAQMVSITGNSFSCSVGCSASTGIVLGSAVTSATVSGNTYFNGYTTKVNNSATLASIYDDNFGGASSAIAVGASPFTYTAGATPETVYIRGGTVSVIATGGNTVLVASPGTVDLYPRQTVTVTYSVLPTMLTAKH